MGRDTDAGAAGVRCGPAAAGQKGEAAGRRVCVRPGPRYTGGPGRADRWTGGRLGRTGAGEGLPARDMARQDFIALHPPLPPPPPLPASGGSKAQAHSPLNTRAAVSP